MRILVVDDGAEVQKVRGQLVPRGIEVAGASNADDAFRLWEKECPWALVLTEYHIEPGTRIRDGRELVNAIRAADPSQRMAIHTGDEGLLAAPVVVLRKPYAIERLLRMLRQPVLPLTRPFDAAAFGGQDTRNVGTMPQAYEAWLDQVRDALRSINMAMEDWQPIWSFDFPREHKAGTKPGDAVVKANRFWWHEQKKAVRHDCLKTPDCWLPRGHQGKCQLVS